MGLRGVSQANLELSVLQETNLTYVVYTRGSVGYIDVATYALRQHCGGVAVFYHALPRISVKVLHQFGNSAVVFQLATGGR